MAVTNRSRAVFLAFLPLSLLLQPAAPQTPAPVTELWTSITAFPGYINLRRCAADCLYEDCHSDSVCSATRGSIDAKLHCDLFYCICQQDKIASASAPILSCAMARCSSKADANAAWDVFTSYCYAKSPQVPTPPPGPPGPPLSPTSTSE
jgi:hypothetical protein